MAGYRTLTVGLALSALVAVPVMTGAGEEVAQKSARPAVSGTRAGSFASMPLAKPEEVGLSSERLKRIRDAVQRHMESGDISGGVVAVARRGRVVFAEPIGLMDVETKKPVARDTIFRIFSMSKPITSVAVMMMFEEGKLRLTDPVSRFIPEFRNMKVALPKTPPGGNEAAPGGQAGGRGGRGGRGTPPSPSEYDLVDAEREITIHDLLTHTSGLGSAGLGSRIGSAMAPRSQGETLASYIPKLGKVPLDFQPGTRWAYSGAQGPEVLSRIVEIVSGQTYDAFLRDRLFGPLGMKDTSFSVPEDKLGRLHTAYQSTAGKLSKSANQGAGSGPVYFSGAMGLVSTAEDYLRFAQMLANGGVLNGKRILAPRTIAIMSANHLGDLYNQGQRTHGMGFGLLVEVVQDTVISGRNLSVGSFGWDGAAGTRMWVDPKEKLAIVILVQTSFAASVQLHRDVENAVAQSIIQE